MKKLLKILFLFILEFILCSSQLFAHEIRPAYLEISETGKNQYSVLWKVPRVNDFFPSIKPVFSKNFNLQSIGIPEATGASFIFNYKLIGIKSLDGEIIAIEGLSKTMIDALVKINYINGETVTMLLQPSKTTDKIPVKFNTISVIKTYTQLGIEHILQGVDHLLFVLALIIITCGAWTIFKTITAFTIAHSITLSLAVLGFVHIPSPPVEATIALSIVFLAVEIINKLKGKHTITGSKTWLVAFTFGLLHGLGFASALAQVGLPQNDIPLALAFFNIGVELGQITFISIMLILIKVISLKKNWPLVVKKIPAYGIGAIAAYWLIERLVSFIN